MILCTVYIFLSIIIRPSCIPIIAGESGTFEGEAFACAAFFLRRLCRFFLCRLCRLFFGIGIFPVDYRIKWCFDVLLFWRRLCRFFSWRRVLTCKIAYKVALLRVLFLMSFVRLCSGIGILPLNFRIKVALVFLHVDCVALGGIDERLPEHQTKSWDNSAECFRFCLSWFFLEGFLGGKVM